MRKVTFPPDSAEDFESLIEDEFKVRLKLFPRAYYFSIGMPLQQVVDGVG
jgi:hypothetical protein